MAEHGKELEKIFSETTRGRRSENLWDLDNEVGGQAFACGVDFLSLVLEVRGLLVLRA